MTDHDYELADAAERAYARGFADGLEQAAKAANTVYETNKKYVDRWTGAHDVSAERNRCYAAREIAAAIRALVAKP